MAWPHVVKLNATCPQCGRSTDLEVIHQPFERVHGSRDRIYRSFTWADCAACRYQWQIDSSIARDALPAA